MDITFDFATRDDCLNRMVPSDLRKLVNERDSALAEVIQLREEVQRVLELLMRARKFVEADAQMVADISRHAPLPSEAQAEHDTTEFESEVLLREIDTFLKTMK